MYLMALKIFQLNLFKAIRVGLLNLHMRAWENLEAFASELFIYIYIWEV